MTINAMANTRLNTVLGISLAPIDGVGGFPACMIENQRKNYSSNESSP